jgi:nucleotide-binding universal stress UspA family protein
MNSSSYEESGSTYHKAIEDFHNARRKAALESVMALFRGKPADLLSYDEVRHYIRTIESANRRLEDIPIDKIVGSVNRYTDFSRTFLPRNESDASRWARVRLGVENLEGLPPIDTYKVGDVYFVLDGHHRVSVARELGAKTIEGFVTPVYTHVPLSPGDHPDDLILKSEYDEFLARTHLDDLRPGANLLVTAPGQYQQLLEHISVHRYFMGEKRKSDIPYEEAVADWYDTVYLPVARLIRDRNLLRDFPGRTETDLYLWIMDHRSTISQGGLGWEVRPELAAADLVNRYSSAPNRRFPRLVHTIQRIITPSLLLSGPPPGSWRQEHQNPHRGDRLFDDILVAVPEKNQDCPAITMALEIARREDARLTGFHVVKTTQEIDSPVTQKMQSEFIQRCTAAGITGRLVVEAGQAAPLLVQRSPWVDLIVFRLNYPPPNQIIQRLRSGVRLMIRRSSALLLAVPDAPFRLERALIAYGPGRNADEALYVATYLAGKWGIQLSVVTVCTRSKSSGQDASAEVETPCLIERARQYLESHGIQAEYIEEFVEPHSDAANAVLLNAESQNTHLIIMGGYEATPLREAFTGSTVDHVLRSTRRPVLICR